MLKSAKLHQFSQRVADLADEPMMSPAALKARFDACPEELRGKHNELIDGLTAAEAASSLGFGATAGVPAENVQGAIENVQQQLQDAMMGTVPSGSIGHDMLDQELRDTLTNLRDDLTTESTTRDQTDQGLQQQIGLKCQVVIGTYEGNGTQSQTIDLGFQPRAVLIAAKSGVFSKDSQVFGGLANATETTSNLSVATITENGFTVYWTDNAITNSNHPAYNPYTYIAFV